MLHYRRCFLEKGTECKICLVEKNIAKLGNIIDGWKVTVVWYMKV